MLKGKVFWLLLNLTITSILFTFPPTSLSQEIEQEPNDPCTSAQILGEVVLPSSVEGSLEYYDVDFFRFSATPDNYLVANLDGVEGDLSALSDPYLGLFDSNCNLLASNDDYNGVNSQIRFEVPGDGDFILAATSCCDSYFMGSYSSGSYRLSLDETVPPSSISGRVVDAETGLGLPGNSEPYAQVTLYECYTSDCSFSWDIYWEYTDSEGRFSIDSSWYGGDLPAGIYQLRASARNYVSQFTDPIQLEEAEQFDVGDISLEPQALADSVTGRLVDAVTGVPLSGTSWPYAYAELYYCNDGESCSYLSWENYTHADTDGVIRFETDNAGSGLITGWYRIYAYASDYDRGDSGVFELVENEQEDLGDIALMPPPITFSEIRPCGDLPIEGGKCRFSVRVTSNLPSEFKLGAWSLVEAYSTGSELGWTEFQAGQAKTLELDTGESMVARFSFDVPETVQNGVYICPDIWVGLGEKNPYFDTLAHDNSLFCITKGLTSTYSVLSKQAAKAIVRGQHGSLIRNQPAR